jgi:hypothetical protein
MLRTTLACCSFALLAPALQPQECPEICLTGGYATTFGSSDCVSITTTILSTSNGAGKELCTKTCTWCSALVKMEWNCTTCANPNCAYVTVAQTYDTNGNPLPADNNTGAGPGSERKFLFTNCGGSNAFFGISVGGVNVTHYLTCSCD